MKIDAEKVLDRVRTEYMRKTGHTTLSRQIEILTKVLVEEVNQMQARVALTQAVAQNGGRFERPVKNCEPPAPVIVVVADDEQLGRVLRMALCPAVTIDPTFKPDEHMFDGAELRRAFKQDHSA